MLNYQLFQDQEHDLVLLPFDYQRYSYQRFIINNYRQLNHQVQLTIDQLHAFCNYLVMQYHADIIGKYQQQFVLKVPRYNTITIRSNGLFSFTYPYYQILIHETLERIDYKC